MTERELLARTAEIAADYVESLDTRAVGPARTYRELQRDLDMPVPEAPSEPLAVIEELTRLLDPGLTAMGSGRFFGFVIGGALPSTVAADWLVTAWDQNACLAEPTPGAAALETVAGRWVLELLGLPAESSFAFVTGCQMAHVTCLAAARHAVYDRVGWDLPAQGLAGAPPLRVVVGSLGAGRLRRVRVVRLGLELCLQRVGRARRAARPRRGLGDDDADEDACRAHELERCQDLLEQDGRGEHDKHRLDRRDERGLGGPDPPRPGVERLDSQERGDEPDGHEVRP